MFPAPGFSTAPDPGILRRHHLHPETYSKALRRAAETAGIEKRFTSYVFRHGHSFATHLQERGSDVRTVRELLGHNHLETTQIYLHVMKAPGVGARSPLDG